MKQRVASSQLEVGLAEGELQAYGESRWLKARRRLGLPGLPALDRRSLPLLLLAIVSLVSFGARIAWIGQPCQVPCTQPTNHVLIFDETYYVTAARAIAGIKPGPKTPYAGSPAGVDPNSEHPQLTKLVIAGSIELFGDGPFAWRIPSVILGSLAILGMFMLVQSVGGGPWQALGASTLMAADGFLLIDGRIGTLEIYAVAAMIWVAVLYLHRRPFAAGILMGIGACAKEVVPYVGLAFVIIELYRWLITRRQGAASGDWSARLAIRRLVICAVCATVVFLGLVEIFDQIAPPYDPIAHEYVGGGLIGHLEHMVHYRVSTANQPGPNTIASSPWGWLVDYKPITYLFINPARPSPELENIYPAVYFLGIINPPILAAALIGLVTALVSLGRGVLRRVSTTVPDNQNGLAILAVAWVIGTWVPFLILRLFFLRITYFYYASIITPGVYLGAAYLCDRLYRRRGGKWLVGSFGVLVLGAAVVLYPFLLPTFSNMFPFSML